MWIIVAYSNKQVWLWTSQRQAATERLNLTKRERLQLAGCNLDCKAVTDWRKTVLMVWVEWWEGLRCFWLPCMDIIHINELKAVLTESGSFKKHNIMACKAQKVITKNVLINLCTTHVRSYASKYYPITCIHLCNTHYSPVMSPEKDTTFPTCSYRNTETEKETVLLLLCQRTGSSNYVISVEDQSWLSWCTLKYKDAKKQQHLNHYTL